MVFRLHLSLLQYALGIHLPRTSLTLLIPLSTDAITAATVTNDYFSCRKEFTSSRTQAGHRPNLVHILFDGSNTGLHNLPNALSRTKSMALIFESRFKAQCDRKK